MKSLPERIIALAEAEPEATPICPSALLHLGSRGAVDQALSRLARSGRLLRICRGVYMRPIETRFGRIPPSIAKSLQSLSELWGETIVPTGGSAANWLGLTEGVPVRSVYLTSGRNRRLYFRKHPVELRHAPRWQLTAPHRMAGVVIRALAWLGPRHVETSLDAVLPKLSREDLAELAAARAVMPGWMAEPISRRLAHA
ncbi:MAG: AbiEi antitoxin N-terminal domain-containing protein [Gemmatimonadota bacterium]|nr:AbiEi antitoxin N-terminal domain-containing protein [Gemmatimonadota bacterium]MDE2870628.1 AbiEi antitoxin N-terminal domain-containing protein [Gemmatimonadota bacterium]